MLNHGKATAAPVDTSNCAPMAFIDFVSNIFLTITGIEIAVFDKQQSPACRTSADHGSSSNAHACVSVSLINFQNSIMEERPFTKKDLHSIYKDVYDIGPQWYNLGLALGLLADELDNIKALHRDNPSECLREMLRLWLSKTSIKSTRQTLIDALRERTVRAEDLADELKVKYVSHAKSLNHNQMRVDHELLSEVL